MATILLTWEYGGGLGHMLRLRPIGEALVARGHKVVAAFRDLSHVGEVFAGSGISFVQAPTFKRDTPLRLARLSGILDILANIGFADPRAISHLFTAWNALFDELRPELVVADYSPNALLALRGRRIRRANVGVGFYCPPDRFPLPSWSGAQGPAPVADLVADEQALTVEVNTLLTAHQRPPLERLSQIANDVDELFLATYKEFDPYGPRPGATYWGHWHWNSGIAPKWPAGPRPRIYAYLKPFAGREELLRQLQRVGKPTIVLAGDQSDAMHAQYTSSTMCLERAPLDMKQAAEECDLAILNAGHGAIASMLMAGKPCLVVPVYIEQFFNAQALVRAKAGRWVAPSAIGTLGTVLNEMLSTSTYIQGARAFAASHADCVPGQQVPAIVARLEALLATAPAASF